MRFDQDEIDEDDDEVVFDVLVDEAFASRTLCEPDAFSEGSVIRILVFGEAVLDGVATFYTDWHLGESVYWRGDIVVHDV